MLRRVIIYLSGFIIGCFFVYFSLIKDRGRDFSGYFPNSRVLKKVSRGLDTTNTKYLCFRDCFDLKNTEFKELVLEGEVDFDKSQTETEPRKYLINSNFHGLEYMFEVTLQDTLASLNYFYGIDVPKSCNCD
jgi:hypothetical protein